MAQEAQQGKDQAISPIGDFIAMVAAFAGFIFAVSLNWYSFGNLVKKGVESAVGIICFAVAVGCFAFAIVVLVGRFINPNFRLVRSPGWVYGFASAVIFMVCIVGMVATPKIAGHSSSLNVGIVLELLAAVTIGVGGLLKF
jgi:hypothetical protein